MRLAKLAEFRRLFFTATSAPSLTTLRRKFEKIPGAVMLQGTRYSDLDEFERVIGSRDLKQERISEMRRRIAEIESDPLLKGLV